MPFPPSAPSSSQDNALDEVAKVYAPVGAVNDQRGLNSSWTAGVSHNYHGSSGLRTARSNTPQ